MLEKLRASYAKDITFMRIDWDTYKNHRVTTSRSIPRRSTLVLMKNGKEVGRLVAATSEDAIKRLLDKAKPAKAVN